MYSQTDHYRRLAIAAKLHATQATDPSARTALEEVANYWIALAEQVEWLWTFTPRQIRPAHTEGAVMYRFTRKKCIHALP